jgi:type IV pilus assembly protein PilE
MKRLLLTPHKRHTAKLGRGFTLIELLITVAIVAILTAIAVPSYDGYMVRARRSEAKAIMMRGGLWMERNQSAAFSYAVDGKGVALTTATLAGVGLGRSPENGATVWYSITLDEPMAASFNIRGAALGAQATKDAKCAILVLDHLGRRGIAATLTSVPDFASATALDCWAS